MPQTPFLLNNEQLLESMPAKIGYSASIPVELPNGLFPTAMWPKASLKAEL